MAYKDILLLAPRFSRQGKVFSILSRVRLSRGLRRLSMRSMASIKAEEVPDKVVVKQLQLESIINRVSKHLLISCEFFTNFEEASKFDDLKYSINYAVVCRNFKNFEKSNKSKNFSYLSLVNELFNQIIFKENCQLANLEVQSKEPDYDLILKFQKNKQLIERPENKNDADQYETDKISIRNFKMNTVIGIFTFERFQKQPVELNIDIDYDLKNGIDFDALTEKIKTYIGKSNFKTVEALVLNVNKLIFREYPKISNCNVNVLKTNIIDYANVGVSCNLHQNSSSLNGEILNFDQNDINIDKFNIPIVPKKDETNEGEHEVYVAFGSNEGHQLHNILEAINELDSHDSIKVLQTSSLYKSKPMYFLDQADFINGCLKLRTSLNPFDLLKYLKDIEYKSLKRVKQFDNGPRTIDLDILLYGSQIINSEELNIPHIRMIERSFVMIPLCELISKDFIHPVTAEPIHDHLNQLMESSIDPEIQESIDLVSLIPLPTRFPMLDEKEEKVKFRYLEYDLINNKTATQLMGILNITPDSFSDGSISNLNLSTTMEKVDEMFANKVDIIDIGGCSTRPGAKQPTLQDELDRVLPVIKEIKKKYGDSIRISVDTYRSQVAEESIKLGADIINDISGGSFDERMYDVISEYGVPYIINHTRGDISTMNKLTDYSKTDDENIKVFNGITSAEDVIVNEIGKEMSSLLEKMYAKGIKRWQIIIDPGLGFAKNVNENLSVIRNLPNFKRYSQFNQTTKTFINFKYLPVLLGPSRKKFIGTITGKETASERINGTSASITAGIGFGSDIVRVHDFKEMKDVCLMGDAIYKNIH